MGKVGKDTFIDVAGNVYISYYDDSNKDLKFAQKVGGIWQTEVADSGAGSCKTSETDVGEVSRNNQPLMVSQRTLYKNSFNELLGLTPTSRHDSTCRRAWPASASK